MMEMTGRITRGKQFLQWVISIAITFDERLDALLLVYGPGSATRAYPLLANKALEAPRRKSGVSSGS